MKRLFLFISVVFLGIGILFAEGKKQEKAPSGKVERGDTKEPDREFSIIVYERESGSPLTFQHEISNGRGGFIDGLFDTYRSTFAGKVTNLSTNILGVGVDLLVKAITQKRDNKAKWHSTIQKEMTYTKKLPMQTEIADFYKTTSSIGAMDPSDMIFKGFGCRQYLSYKDTDGTDKKILVFEIACSLDDSSLGKQRIIHHGKFVIKVDSIRFNPYLCELPNDSLRAEQVDAALRIPFDFKRRKDLNFKLTANISSSWMNEAIEIYKDQLLGQFNVEFTIPDSTALDHDGPWKGYFTYNSSSLYDRQHKIIMVSGESFIVPRSFVGNYSDDDNLTPSTTPLWGTGQYRIDMQITESCQMNELFYKSEDAWKDEWKKIRKRKKSPSFFDTIVEKAKTEFDWDNHKWVYTILDPVKSAIIVDETKWVNRIITGSENAVTTYQENSPSSGDKPTSDGMTGGNEPPKNGDQPFKGKLQ